MKITVIEGNTLRLDGGAMFGHVPKELWKRWMIPDENNRVSISSRSLLMQTDDGKLILFDTGVGAFFEPKLKERYGVVETEHLLLKNLLAAGVKDTDIDAVVLSHLHFDHVGGLLSSYDGSAPRLLFPNAKFYMSPMHWEHALCPHIRDKSSFIPLIQALLLASNRLKFVYGPSHPDFPDAVHFQLSQGHTVGLMVATLELNDGPLMLASDIVPGMAWVHLPITTGYDRYPELVVNEKQQLFEALMPRGGRLLFPHDPQTAMARIEKNTQGNYVGKTDG
jgi:glyoxylase-like metal-dependent hydrolase (beta-lactamase superfamily II)